MKRVFDLKGYVGRNIVLSTLWMLHVVMVSSFAPIINSVLIDTFKIPESEIGFISILLIFGFLMSSFLNSHFMNNHVNIVNVIMGSTLVFMISMILELILLSQDSLNYYLFALLRSMDGASSLMTMI